MLVKSNVNKCLDFDSKHGTLPDFWQKAGRKEILEKKERVQNKYGLDTKRALLNGGQ